MGPRYPLSTESIGSVPSPPRSRAAGRRILLTMLVLGTLSCGIGAATLADFTASTTYTGQAFSAANVQINGNNQNDTSSLSLNLSNMVPGDSVTRTLAVVNTGATDIIGYSLTTVATTSSALDQGSPSPLRIWISRCSVAWTGTTCNGGTASDLVGTSAAPTNVIFSSQSLATPGGGSGVFCKHGYADHAARGVGACDVSNVADADYIKIRVSLASSGAPGSGADNALQGLTSTVRFEFYGSQPPSHGF